MAGDDQSHTNSSPPASTQQRYLTRASTSGANKTVLYDAKYHPMDDVTRPSQARKHKKRRGISISSEDDEEENFSPFTRHSPSPFSSSDGNNPANCDSPWQPRERFCAGYSLRKPPASAPIYKKTWHPQDKELGIAHRQSTINSNRVRVEPPKKRKPVPETSQSDNELPHETRKRPKVFLISDDDDSSSSVFDNFATDEHLQTFEDDEAGPTKGGSSGHLAKHTERQRFVISDDQEDSAWTTTSEDENDLGARDNGLQSWVGDIIAENDHHVASKNKFQTGSSCTSLERQEQLVNERPRLVSSPSARSRSSTSGHMNNLSGDSEEALYSCSDSCDKDAAIRDLSRIPCVAGANTHRQDDSDSVEFNADNTSLQTKAQEALEMREVPENHDDHDFYQRSLRPTQSQDGLFSEAIATEETYHPISPGFSSSPPSPRRTSAKDGAKQADRIEDAPFLDSTYSSGKPMLEAPRISIFSKLTSSILREASRKAAAVFEAEVYNGLSRSSKSTTMGPYQCPVSDEFLASMSPIVLRGYVKERQSDQSGSVDCDSTSGLSMRQPSSTVTGQTPDQRPADDFKAPDHSGESLSEEVTRIAACEVNDPVNDAKTDRSLESRGFHGKEDAEKKDQDMRNKQRQASSMKRLSQYQSQCSSHGQRQASIVPNDIRHPSPGFKSLARETLEAGLRKTPKMQPKRDPHYFQVCEDINGDHIDSAQLPQTRYFDDVDQENLRFGSDGQMDEREGSDAGDNFIATIRKPTEIFCSTEQHQTVASTSHQASSHGDEMQTRPPTAAISQPGLERRRVRYGTTRGAWEYKMQSRTCNAHRGNT
ncbi:MAG: hypothetical protein M1821_000573 [Bathelium mastoideum]|nr:MAG: hypothetical protein M1821_000573 [Bathelium mastoideum]